MKKWTVQDIPSQTGRLAIVTGATGGLGYETALELARAGAEVVVAARNVAKGRDAVERIQREVAGAKVRFGLLDLASLTSIEAFAEGLLAERRFLDLLINNAGVMALPTRQVTADGFEMQLGTNHLGHFALTGRLLPLLRLGRGARVVNVSSLMHKMGASIHFDDLQMEKKYTPNGAYAQSKLANLLFTFELQRKSDAGGWGLLSDAAHPGASSTDLIANGPGAERFPHTLAPMFVRWIGQNAAAGAWPTLYAATAPQAKPMGYYGPNGLFELKGDVASAAVSRQAQDVGLAERFWKVSEQLTGVRF
jgi:NAD(P)-dependent dehydrogenase (short-subunit alcohol dehydrogenase family)